MIFEGGLHSGRWRSETHALARCGATTYPKISTIQRCKREKSVGDQTAVQVHFLFVFQDIFDDDLCQME